MRNTAYIAITAFALLTLLSAVNIASAQDKAIQPQQTITLTSDAFGCVSKDKFDSADQHARAGEQQKMQQFFEGYECIPTPEDARFRVVKVDGHDIEFVNAANSDTQGLWTADRFIKQ